VLDDLGRVRVLDGAVAHYTRGRASHALYTLERGGEKGEVVRAELQVVAAARPPAGEDD
jgi:hypothetical protein